MFPFASLSQHKIIYFFSLSLIAASLCGVSSSTYAEENIPEQLEAYWSGAPDAYEKFKSCLPFSSEASFKSAVINIADKTIAKIGNPNPLKATNYVLAQNDAFVCVNLNTRNKPIVPLSFFYGTIAFTSQSNEERKILYKDLAQQLAMHGFAQAMIVMDNGSAIHISYMNESASPIRIYYNTSHLKQGEYNEQDFKPIYRIKTSEVSVTAYDNHGNSKSLIQGITAPRPQKDGFLVISGTSQTGVFPFANTKWKLESLGSILFKDGGKLVYEYSNGSMVEGDWRVENNAMYFRYGQVYFSSILNNKGDELLSEGRSAMPTSLSKSMEAQGMTIKERHWKAKWLRAAY